jgi:hypothetical protein
VWGEAYSKVCAPLSQSANTHLCYSLVATHGTQRWKGCGSHSEVHIEVEGGGLVVLYDDHALSRN